MTREQQILTIIFVVIFIINVLLFVTFYCFKTFYIPTLSVPYMHQPHRQTTDYVDQFQSPVCNGQSELITQVYENLCNIKTNFCR